MEKLEFDCRLLDGYLLFANPDSPYNSSLPCFVLWRISCRNFINKLPCPRLPVGLSQWDDWWRVRSGCLSLYLPSHWVSTSWLCVLLQATTLVIPFFTFSLPSYPFLSPSGVRVIIAPCCFWPCSSQISC